MKSFDFIVIGSGVAGLSFALKAAAHGQVAIVTKRAPADSNTAWAQGGVACVWSSEDTFELHVQDTLEAGAGLCDEAAVRAIVGDGPARIRELIGLGVHFDEKEAPADGSAAELDLGREGGHSRRRVLHSRDTTGREIEESLLRAVAADPNIAVLDHHMAVDLITSAKLGFSSENRCLGVYVLNEVTGEVETFRTLRLILATGGCGKVYLYTTNPERRDGRRGGDGLSRGGAGGEHGVHSISSDVFVSPRSAKSFFDQRKRCAGKVRHSASNGRGPRLSCRAYHRAGVAGAARYRGAGDRCGD